MSIRLVTSCSPSDVDKLTWMKFINFPAVCYFKTDSLNIGQIIQTGPFSFAIPNYGRCEYAFLLHIINNYDNLDDVTIFTKANWADENVDLHGVIQQAPYYDYVNGGNMRMYEIWRSDYSRDKIPQGWKENHIEYFINPDPRGYGAHEMYNLVFPSTIPKPDVIPGVGHGPCYSVKKEIIRRWPLSVYKELLDVYHHVEYVPEFEKEFQKKNSIYFYNQWIRFNPVFFTHNLECTKYFF